MTCNKSHDTANRDASVVINGRAEIYSNVLIKAIRHDPNDGNRYFVLSGNLHHSETLHINSVSVWRQPSFLFRRGYDLRNGEKSLSRFCSVGSRGVNQIPTAFQNFVPVEFLDEIGSQDIAYCVPRL